MATATSRRMKMRTGPIVTLIVCAAMSACGTGPPPGSPVAPTPTGLPGEWIGATDQGRQITLSISLDRRITSMTFDYVFPDCSGSVTFSNEDQSAFTGGGLVFGKSLSTGPSGMTGHAVVMPDNSLWGLIALYESRTCRGGATRIQCALRSVKPAALQDSWSPPASVARVPFPFGAANPPGSRGPAGRRLTDLSPPFGGKLA